MHVLVVHSDPHFYREVMSLLTAHEASGAYLSNLADVCLQVEAQYPDLIILEQRCLSTGSKHLGTAFSRSQRLPVVFLTAADSVHIRAGEEHKRLTDLLAFVRSQTERVRSQQVMQIGQLRIHSGRMRVALGERWIRLPPIQFRLLQHLATRANAVVSHRELTTIVWGAEAADDEARRDVLKAHIMQLRRMLGPEFKDYIQTVRGQGYILIDPDADD